LDKDDIARLLSPVHATEARIDVSGKIAQNYQKKIDKNEAIIAEQIFRLLARDTELEVRKQLSERLKTSGALPRDIALTMANDVVEVALPMLECSKVLSDRDLLELISATDDDTRHTAIARREEVSEQVVGGLLKHSDSPHVATALARNDGAALNEEFMQHLIERHQGQAQVMDMLASRATLPITIAEKVISHVSDHLKTHLARTYQVGITTLAKPVQQQSREAATLALIRENISTDELKKLVEQLITFDRLTPSLLMASIAQGYVNFFAMSIAILAGIPLENAIKLINDRGGLGFRALYNKLKLPSEYFSTMRDIIHPAIALKEEMPALEGDAFAQMLARKIRQIGKEEGKVVDHIAKLVENSGR
jgi:uncharacterized protein (DUF2336 family)